MRERELERDLLRATERCIELQVALNEEKANVDILTNRAGNLNKKKFAQETIQLKQQLDKKTHDLQAIIWKMNELHLINKTYNEKMSNREQHVTYLEENLVELQSSNRNMILERQEAEDKLRQELENLKVLVDAMTIPLWQFGECGITGRTLASRIRLPVRGGEGIEDDDDDDGDESLESVEESVVSDDEEEEDEEEEDEEESVVAEVEPEPAAAPAQVQIISQPSVPMRDATTQTAIDIDEKGTMTEADSVQPPTRWLRDTNAVGGRHDAVTSASKSYASVLKEADYDDGISTSKSQDGTGITEQSSVASKSTSTRTSSSIQPNGLSRVASNDDESNTLPTSEDFFLGGKPASSQPRRFVPKFGIMIRPGVLKEVSSKSKSSDASVSSSRTRS
jgi:PAS domain-containing protein